MELGSQSLNDLLPILMGRQAASWRTGNTVFTVKLHIQWVESMSARTDCNPNRISILRYLIRVCIGRRFVLGFVQLEADLGQIIELGNCRTFDFGLDATFKDTIEQSVDVRFFGEVEEGFRFVRCLHFFEVLDDFLGCCQRSVSITDQNMLTLSKGREVKRPISSFSLSAMPYSCGQMKSKRTLASLYSSLSFSRRASVFALVWLLPVKRRKYCKIQPNSCGSVSAAYLFWWLFCGLGSCHY